MLRSVLAVLAGFVATAILVMLSTAAAAAAFGLPLMPSADRPLRIPGSGYLAANLVLSALAALVGGWLAGLVARRRPLAHAGALAILLGILGLTSLGQPQPGQPAWYPYALLVLGPGGALVGGLLRRGRESPPRSPHVAA